MPIAVGTGLGIPMLNEHVGPGGGGAVVPGPSSGDGLLLEDGTSFLLLEDGSFLLLE